MPTVNAMPAEPIVETRQAWVDEWVPVPYFRALEVSGALMPTAQTATLLWRYGQIKRPGATAFAPIAPIGEAGIGDGFLRVRTDATPSIVLFVGRANTIADRVGAGDQLAGGSGEQVVTCYGLEDLLARADVTGSYAWVDGAVVQLHTRLDFNSVGRAGAGGGLVGNRSTATHTINGVDVYLFADDGELWTARQMIDYLLAAWGPTSPQFALAAGDELAALDATIDAWPCPDTVAYGISAVVGRRRGLCWNVICPENTPQVKIHSILDADLVVGDFTLPGNGVIAALVANPGVQLESLTVARHQDVVYDEITVYGAPLWVAAEIAHGPAWSEAEQTLYDDADNAERSGDRLSRVYRDYRPAATLVTAGPTVDADGTFDMETPAPFLALGRTFTRELPMAKGTEYHNGVVEVVDADAADELLPLAVYAPIDLTGGGTRQVLLNQLGTLPLEKLLGLSVLPLGGELGFRVEGAYSHLLGLNHFTGDPGTEGFHARIDYEDLTVVAGLRTDQRIRLTRTITAGTRRLVLEVPDAECWLIAPDTPTGVDADGAFLAPDDWVVVRNDYDRLEAVAALAAAWYGRTRRAVTLVWRDILTDFAAGHMVSNVTCATRTFAVNAIVSRLVWDFEGKRTILTTDFSELDLPGMGYGFAAMARGGGRAAAAADAPGRPREALLPVRLAAPPPPAYTPGCAFCGVTPTPENYTVTFSNVLQCSDDEAHAINGTAILLTRPTSVSCSWTGTAGGVTVLLTKRDDLTWDLSATDYIFNYTYWDTLPGFAGPCNADLGVQANTLAQGDCIGAPFTTTGYAGTANILVGDQT